MAKMSMTTAYYIIGKKGDGKYRYSVYIRI